MKSKDNKSSNVNKNYKNSEKNNSDNIKKFRPDFKLNKLKNSKEKLQSHFKDKNFKGNKLSYKFNNKSKENNIKSNNYYSYRENNNKENYNKENKSYKLDNKRSKPEFRKKWLIKSY